mgnify:CR=1 FL=1
MSLPRFANLDGSPAADAAWMNIVLASALYANDRRPFDDVARAYSGEVRFFKVTPTTYEPDVGVIISDNDVLVVMSGSTNSPQLLGHAGGAIVAEVDREIPVTGLGVAQENASFKVGADLIIPSIIGSLPTIRVQNMRITGHSYGGAIAHIMARRLANAVISPSNIELMTFGQPRTFDGRPAIHEPDYYARIINPSVPGLDRLENVLVDPVCTSPPAVMFLGRYGFTAKFLQKWLGFFWTHHGNPWLLNFDNFAKPDPFPLGIESLPFVNLGEFLLNSTLLPLHYERTYTSRCKSVWEASRQSPSLSFLTPYAMLYSGGTILPPLLGPPLTAAQLNLGYFEPPSAPVTQPEIATWEVISAAGIYSPAPVTTTGDSKMTLQKGTMAFNTGQGGFSESLYSGDPGDSILDMMTKMQGAMNYLCRLFICNDSTGPTSNPVIPQFVRVNDVLLKRVGIVQSESVVRPSFFATGSGVLPQPAGAPAYQNLDNQLGWRIVWNSGASRQTAAQCLHGVPVQAFAASNVFMGLPIAYPSAFLREARPGASWLSRLAAYVNFLYAQKLGFRTIRGDWNNVDGSPGAFSTPTAVYYNGDMQMVELQWAGAPPEWGSTYPDGPTKATYMAQKPANWPAKGSRCRLQVRSWKGFQVLAGRWSAVVVEPQLSPTAYTFALRILRTCRQPTVSNKPAVSPIAWDVWWPGAATIGNPTGSLTAQNQILAANFAFIESKKLGRNFEESRGRIRNRPT